MPNLARVLLLLHPFTDNIGLIQKEGQSKEFEKTVDALQLLYNYQMLTTEPSGAEDYSCSRRQFQKKKFTMRAQRSQRVLYVGSVTLSTDWG
jgi:hypothetical protein